MTVVSSILSRCIVYHDPNLPENILPQALGTYHQNRGLSPAAEIDSHLDLPAQRKSESTEEWGI